MAELFLCWLDDIFKILQQHEKEATAPEIQMFNMLRLSTVMDWDRLLLHDYDVIKYFTTVLYEYSSLHVNNPDLYT